MRRVAKRPMATLLVLTAMPFFGQAAYFAECFEHVAVEHATLTKPAICADPMRPAHVYWLRKLDFGPKPNSAPSQYSRLERPIRESSTIVS
jgi:hypothetical protein